MTTETDPPVFWSRISLVSATKPLFPRVVYKRAMCSFLFSLSQDSGGDGGRGILGRRYRTLSDPSRPVLIEGRSSRRNIPLNRPSLCDAQSFQHVVNFSLHSQSAERHVSLTPDVFLTALRFNDVVFIVLKPFRRISYIWILVDNATYREREREKWATESMRVIGGGGGENGERIDAR